jgi:hypothetical protein
MEAAMTKRLATITGTAAVLAAALLVSGGAEAGGSSSAASKYRNSNQISTAYLTSGKQQARRADYGITEFSSSSTRTHAAKYR